MELISKRNFDFLEKGIRPYFTKPLIFDTGPLVFLLIGLYDGSKKTKKDIWQGHTEEDLNLILRLSKKFKGIVITPQILAECTNLLNQKSNPEKYKYLLRRIIEPIKKYGEIYIDKNIILDCPKFSEFGSTDISIIECSKKLRSPIITEDAKLYSYCYGNKIPIINFHHLRPSLR